MTPVSQAFVRFDAAYCAMLQAAAEVRRAVAAEAGVKCEHPCKQIISLVARHYGFAPEEILSKRRFHDLVTARHVAMWLSRSLTTFSLQAIAGAFGVKVHGTVMWAIESVGNRAATEPKFASELMALSQRCREALK